MLVLTVGFIVFTIDFLYFHSIVSGEQRRAGWRRGTGAGGIWAGLGGAIGEEA